MTTRCTHWKWNTGTGTVSMVVWMGHGDEVGNNEHNRLTQNRVPNISEIYLQKSQKAKKSETKNQNADNCWQNLNLNFRTNDFYKKMEKSNRRKIKL